VIGDLFDTVPAVRHADVDMHYVSIYNLCWMSLLLVIACRVLLSSSWCVFFASDAVSREASAR
jgi:hypothetical protein